MMGRNFGLVEAQDSECVWGHGEISKLYKYTKNSVA